MSGLLGEFTKKLGERWIALLALPGLLYLGTVAVAKALGWRHAFDLELLRTRLTAFTEDPDHRATGSAVLLLVAMLLGSAVVGLTVSGLGRLIAWWWERPGLRPPLRGRRLKRRVRWQSHVRAADAPGATPEAIRKHTADADRIAPVEPDRPFWIGDRIRAVHVRTALIYGLDLTAAWPRLWLILPESTQKTITTAAEAQAAAARLYAWALLYAALTPWWYPALPVALVIGATARTRSRSTTRDLADLLEAAVDVHYRDLLTQLGRTPGSGLDPGHGHAVTGWFRRNRWDPESPLGE